MNEEKKGSATYTLCTYNIFTGEYTEKAITEEEAMARHEQIERERNEQSTNIDND